MKSKKRVDVYWTILDSIEKPKSIFRDPVKPEVLAPCPVVSDYSQRSRLLLTPYHLEIKPDWIYDQKTKGSRVSNARVSRIKNMLFQKSEGTHLRISSRSNKTYINPNVTYNI